MCITYQLLISSALLVTCIHGQNERAVVYLQPGSSPTVQGQLTMTATDSGVIIKGQITGLTPGLHGFHIHEKGALGNECKDAGSHFNPFQNLHGDPRDTYRHIGDLGNIEADASGVASIDIYDDRASLHPSSPAYIGGRAVVVHADQDDLGRGPNEESKKTGNAGARVGCGIIDFGQSQTTLEGSQSRSPIEPAILIPFQIQQQESAISATLFQSREEISPSQNFNSYGGSSATVKIIPGSSNTVFGNLQVEEVPSGITVKGFISGLSPGLHGFHIHEQGDLGDQCRNAKGHFNPFNRNHGDPQDHHRHVGDLGNVNADQRGTAYIDIFDPQASLDPHSPAYVGHRAMVVHEKPDDLGRGGNDESLKTGNAGARVGCGVIVIAPAASAFHQQAQEFRPLSFPPYGGRHDQNSQSAFRGSFF